MSEIIQLKNKCRIDINNPIDLITHKLKNSLANQKYYECIYCGTLYFETSINKFKIMAEVDYAKYGFKNCNEILMIKANE